MKRILSIICVIILLATISGCSQKASEGLEFKSNGDGTCVVVGIGSCEDENLIIPKKSPEGDIIVEIGDAAFKNSKLRTVTMPNTITRIGKESFALCYRLETIEFSNSLKQIGSEAFNKCEALVEINLPDSVEEFECSVSTSGEKLPSSLTFANCKELSKINIPKNLNFLYIDTFIGNSLTEVNVDADFQYGDFSVSFYQESIECYASALYLKNPETNGANIVKLNDTLKTVIYNEFFGNGAVKINGEELTMPEAQYTPGTYGNEKNTDGFSLTEDGKIKLVQYDTKYGKYEVETNYSDGTEKIYKFEYDSSLQSYIYTDADNDTYRFVVYGDYLFTQNDTFVLNAQYKG